MDPSDSRPVRPTVMHSRRPSTPSPPTGRVSQVPRLIFPRALSPITPEGSTAARARGLTVDGRLHHIRQVGRPHWFNEAESGSQSLRLTGSLGGASTAGSLRAPPAPLPAVRALRRITTSQAIRSARLDLAHRIQRTIRKVTPNPVRFIRFPSVGPDQCLPPPAAARQTIPVLSVESVPSVRSV